MKQQGGYRSNALMSTLRYMQVGVAALAGADKKIAIRAKYNMLAMFFPRQMFAAKGIVGRRLGMGMDSCLRRNDGMGQELTGER